MLPGLYAAASGIVAIENRQDIIANNIANASTVGFRRQQPVQKGFYDVFVRKLTRPARFNSISAPGGGVKLDESYTDTAGGSMTQTDNPLNVALSGPGFLVVDTPRGERYTRAGNLSVDMNGQLVSPDGFSVEGEGGSGITVPAGELEIASDGSVHVAGATVGKLRVVEFENPHMLTREGQSLYVASDAALQQSGTGEKTTVVPKSLEMSNTNLPKEMIDMILALRAYGANQKVINSVDETMTRVIEQVGAPG